MKLNTAGVVAVVALVALAGCTGFAPGGTPGASPADDPLQTDEPTETTDDDGETMNDDDSTADSGVVRFYISDEQNAIGDFEHLNVTITEVGFQASGDADVGTDDGETDDPVETPENETEAPPENTTDAQDNATDAQDNATDAQDNETEAPEDAGTEAPEDDEADEDESGDWVEYEVDDRTFDLTQLQGENASLLEEFDVPEGSYNKVFVHVDEINGTLENGESVNVKLPSEKLQINQGFTVEANDSVDFVFDITVHKAGNSGKYILTPVISESGTDVPIEDVDEERDEKDEQEDDREDEQEDDREDEQEDDREDERENESNDEASETETELNASFVGTVEPGENATIKVSANGSAVANATVMLGEEVIGETDQAGELSFSVPEGIDELKVVIESGDADTELEVEFEDAPPV